MEPLVIINHTITTGVLACRELLVTLYRKGQSVYLPPRFIPKIADNAPFRIPVDQTSISGTLSEPGTIRLAMARRTEHESLYTTILYMCVYPLHKHFKKLLTGNALSQTI